MGRCCLLALGLLVFSGAGGAAPSTFPPPGEFRYTVFFGNLRPVGTATYRVDPDGEGVFTLKVSDRGRGPNLTGRLRLDASGIPLQEHLTGVDYWQTPIDERFEIVHGKASWSSAAEKGEKKLSRPSLWVTRTAGNPDFGQLAMALFRSPRHTLPLLPEGEARMEAVGSVRVTAKERSKNLTLYAVSGLSYMTLYAWLDESGLFFGRYDGFATVVPEGWEEAAPELIKAQTAIMTARQKAVAARLSHRPSGPVVFRRARLFDAGTATVRSSMTVVVSGNHIQAVGPDGKVRVPRGAQVIDAHGQTLLPGLWDMHQHFIEPYGIRDIASGVTTARDLGNDPDLLSDLTKKWDAGEGIGPRVLMAGVIDGPGPYAAPTQALADTEEKARDWVNRYARYGAVQIKIYSSVDPKLVPAIVAEAHRLGLRVSGHIPNGMNVEQAVREGFDEVQHVNFLFLDFIPGVDTRTMARMSAVAEHAAEIDLDSEPVRAFLRLLKEKKTVVDPTLNLYEDLFTGRADRVQPTLEPVAARLPYQVRRALMGGNLPVPPGMEQRFRDSYRACLVLVRRLYEEGIPIVAGTDSSPGAGLHRELELYVEAGIPAPEVLRIATLGAARVMKRDGELGSVAPGKLADLILVKGDPTKKISDIRRATVVMKDGVIFKPAELYREIGVKPAV
jgi:imidazolonepropionase-like amidohydrolase